MKLKLKTHKIFSNIYHTVFNICMKLVSIPLLLLPIKKNKIVVVNYYGKGYGDNPKYIINSLLTKNKNIEIVWLVKKEYLDCTDLPHDVVVVKYNLLNVLFQLSTSKIWIDNCRKEMWPIKRKGQVYIQTWHGSIGYKQCEKSAQDVLSYSYLHSAKNDSKMADLFISSSDFTTNLYKKDFWYDGEILECGSPRNDEIVNNNMEINDRVRQHFNISDEKKIVLYAPTFRANDSIEAYNMNYDKLLKLLEEKFGREWILFVRLHPNVSEKSEFIKYNDRIVNATEYSDMQELLVASDILITDYSSCIFDFALSKKPAFIYASDIDDYKKDRGFIFNIEDTPFATSCNNDELEKVIKEFNYNEYEKNLIQFYDKQGLYENGNASEQVANYILDKIRQEELNKPKKKMKKENKNLAINTFMLYLMQAATFIFPLLTFPYLTRTLGTDNYGIVVFANAVMLYFQMFIDFGFLLSGTEKCAKERDDISKLSKTTSSIIYSKLILSAIGFIIVIACVLLLDVFKGKEVFIVLSYIPLTLTSFIPDYLFRGIEKMSVITWRTIVSKFLYTIIIFICVRMKDNYFFIPLATFVSNLLIVWWSWTYIKKNLQIKIVKFNLQEVKAALKASSTFFASRIATTASSASNVFVLGLYGYGDATMGIYGAANTLITYGRSMFSPIADSIYPYMIKNKNHKLVRKILLVLCPLIIIGCVVLYIISEFFITLMCGKEYIEAVGIFRKMIPLLALTLPVYLYGYPMLGSINQNSKANLSILISATFHIIGLAILYVSKLLTFDSVVYLTICTEIITLTMRLIFFNKYKNKSIK